MKNRANLDWSSLTFGYVPTDYNVRCYWRNGEWGELEVSSSDTLNMPIGATCLHYGQECFEGMKAFEGKDGVVRLFRPEENAKRMQDTCDGIMMPKLPTDKFIEAVERVIRLNKRFIPPYESGASLYIRPLLIGLGQQIGIKPSNEYVFIVFVSPVGPYFKEGFKPTPMAIMRGYDRAAPLGTGTFKIGGNYAASLKPGVLAHEKGYSAVIYLDAKHKEFIDECGPANFFGIKGNKYITPKSTSILPSITNKSLMQLAEDLGLEVECRPVHVGELSEFDEAGACGTAAVISPISRVDDLDEGVSYHFTEDGKAGAVCEKLYNKLRAIQYGDESDTHQWVHVVAID